MSNILPMLWVGLVGLLLGVFFYGGLWWTIRKSLVSAKPAFWVFISLLVRMGIALAGFYFIAGAHWERIIICLLGFLVARGLVTWTTKLPTENRDFIDDRNSHAS